MGSSLLLVIISILCGVSGQLTLKMGMTQVGPIGGGAPGELLGVALRVLATPLVVAGLGFYALGAVTWLTVLSRVPLSLAYPTLALSYAIVPAMAWLLLGESVSYQRWLGVAAICLGVLFVARS